MALLENLPLSLNALALISLVVCVTHQRILSEWFHEATHWNLLPDRRPEQHPSATTRSRAGERLADVERNHMVAVLEECGWRIRGEAYCGSKLKRQ